MAAIFFSCKDSDKNAKAEQLESITKPNVEKEDSLKRKIFSGDTTAYFQFRDIYFSDNKPLIFYSGLC